MFTPAPDPITARHVPALAPEFAQLVAWDAAPTVVDTAPGCWALRVEINDEVYAYATTDDYAVATTRADIRRWSVTIYGRENDQPETQGDSDESLAAALEEATADFPNPGYNPFEAFGPPLLLVACGARKQQTPATAAELYSGRYFTECLHAAKSVAEDADIRVISARHGLVELADELAPYDARLTRDRRDQVADLIREQATTTDLLRRPVVVLGGRDYVEAARAVWPHAVAPLAGAAIGIQRQRLAQLATA
ncbi:DUF6884 domain-containing protein [Nocardia salmonicida]|uniref:DUF6884 domain-containing protein n=1 Tax=Nocardia salmonicida TaxID=53431 RepID=UPI0033D63787